MSARLLPCLFLFLRRVLYQNVIPGGKYAFDDVSLLSSELEENSITSVETVSLKFRIYEADSYFDIETTPEITFEVK